MNKTIIFSLLITITTTLSHGMELVLHNEDMLSHITEQICNVHNCAIKQTRNNIIQFSITDQKLREYYNREKTHQNIVRHVALHNKMSDAKVAYDFRYNEIVDTIDYLFYGYTGNFKTNPKDFTEYIKDQWYLNSTSSLENIGQETLLLRAIRKNDYARAKIVIAAEIDCNSVRCK